MSRYNIYQPEHYPIAWITAVKLAAERKDSQDCWVSADWARGKAGAVGRMKRLRAFREGLKRSPNRFPELLAVMQEGYELCFRKVVFQNVWDVQLCWKKVDSGVEEIIKGVSNDNKD